MAVTKPVARKLRVGETFKAKLPNGYAAEWTLTRHGDKVAVRQKLTNPKRRSSILLLKKCPVIIELTRIRRASAVFVLVVDFGTVKKS